MTQQRLQISAIAAVLLGVAQYYFLIFCWAYISVHSPLIGWLVDLGLGESVRPVLLLIDLLTSVVLSLPVAFVLTKLRPAMLWLYLLLAVIPGFIWFNWGLVGNSLFADRPGLFMLGWLPELLALPCAAWAVRFIASRVSPNNSFKPNPHQVR